jgi:hypothetical protein
MVITRLTRFLVLLAVLFAPLSMASAHATMAMPAASPTAVADHAMEEASASHCAQMGPTGEEEPAQGSPNDDIDCRVACSCTAPAASQALAEQAAFAPLVQQPEPYVPMSGLSPQAEPRPPQLS